MLSEALASAAGASPGGSGTSMCSAYGTHTRSDRKPPHRSTAGPKPYVDMKSTLAQFPLRPCRHCSHSPQEIWKGTLTSWPGASDSTASPSSLTSATHSWPIGNGG